MIKTNKIYVFGTGGQSKIVTDIAESSGFEVLGYICEQGYDYYLDKKAYSCVEEIPDYKNQKYFIAIGDNKVRERISREYNYLEFVNIIHPSAIISKKTTIGVGNIIMPGVVINIGAQIKNHCIINTGAIIEHDCVVEDFCHLSIRTAVAGEVKLGKKVFLGAGSTVKNGITIQENVIVGVGAAVVKNLEKDKVYVGVPAKFLRDNK